MKFMENTAVGSTKVLWEMGILEIAAKITIIKAQLPTKILAVEPENKAL
jgi:hypothetical protein